MTLGRSANITKPINGRQACHYCGPCERGCVTKSYFNSAFTTVADALATGNCTLIPNAMACKVLTDDANRARGVLYVDRNTREAKEVFGRAVVVSAQALESARLLLNSANERQPNGLANSSGALGHYLMDHVTGGGASGILPMLKPWSESGAQRPNGIYVPRFRNVTDKSSGFLRGYGYQGGANVEKWGHAKGIPGFGPSFKQRVRDERHWFFRFGGFAECLPRFENHVALHKDRVDAWGIPILHIDMAYRDNEKALVKDMSEQAAEMLEAAGAEQVVPTNKMSTPGLGIHEVGTARMGNDPRTSVLNRWQQAHDVPNLFVMDGSVYPSSACQNPTLTIMALTVRSSDYLLNEMKRGSL
jgi:choline dehydrogenase-like flavoprotein